MRAVLVLCLGVLVAYHTGTLVHRDSGSGMTGDRHHTLACLTWNRDRGDVEAHTRHVDARLSSDLDTGL